MYFHQYCGHCTRFFLSLGSSRLSLLPYRSAGECFFLLFLSLFFYNPKINAQRGRRRAKSEQRPMASLNPTESKTPRALTNTTRAQQLLRESVQRVATKAKDRSASTTTTPLYHTGAESPVFSREHTNINTIQLFLH